MSHPVLIIISIIIALFAIFLLIIYLLNEKFRSYPCYFNIIFTISITLDNLIRLIPEGKGEVNDEKSGDKSFLCHIQAFSLTLFDKYEKLIFIFLTIISFLISLITTLVFYLRGISNRSQYCYVETKDKVKQVVDSIITIILLIISLFCILILIRKIIQLKKEKTNENEDENTIKSLNKHLCRFICDFVVTLITFGYVILLINKLINFQHFGKDLTYIILSLFCELFFTINMELIKEVIRIITCKKVNDNENDIDNDSEDQRSLSENFN